MENDYLVLARKYRPQTLQELVGQEALVQTLTHAIERGRIPHGFMFTGIRGVGKTSTARILAKSLMCIGEDGARDAPSVTPCGKCEQCISITQDRNVDVLEMDAASRTGVGDIREIIENIGYQPVAGRYKIYIIDEVHMLSKSAFNALLKTLEEPPAHVKFMFATTEIRKIPVTILSRCMRFDLPRVESSLLTSHMQSVTQREGVNVDDDALRLIAAHSGGSVRDSLSLLDQAISSLGEGDTISTDAVRDMLGISGKAEIFALYDMLLEGRTADMLREFDRMYHSGMEPASIFLDMLEVCHILTQYVTIKDYAQTSDALASLSGDEQVEAERIAGAYGIAALHRLWQIISKGMAEVERSQAPLQASHMLLMRVSYISALPTPDEILRRLEEGSEGGLEESLEERDKKKA